MTAKKRNRILTIVDEGSTEYEDERFVWLIAALLAVGTERLCKLYIFFTKEDVKKTLKALDRQITEASREEIERFLAEQSLLSDDPAEGAFIIHGKAAAALYSRLTKPGTSHRAQLVAFVPAFSSGPSPKPPRPS